MMVEIIQIQLNQAPIGILLISSRWRSSIALCDAANLLVIFGVMLDVDEISAST